MPPTLGAGGLCLALLDLGCSNELRPPSTCQVRNRDLDVLALKPKGQESAVGGDGGEQAGGWRELEGSQAPALSPKGQGGTLGQDISLECR